MDEEQTVWKGIPHMSSICRCTFVALSAGASWAVPSFCVSRVEPPVLYGLAGAALSRGLCTGQMAAE